MTAPGQPFQTVLTKRSVDVVPVTFDWHDFLANQRIVGGVVQVGYVWRPLRAQATGYQYRCSLAGVSSPLDTPLKLPRNAGVVFDDGTLQWTSEVLSTASLRALIGTYTYAALPNTSVVLTDSGNEDQIYTVFVGAGVSGTTYEIKQEIALINVSTSIPTGEEKEGVAVLPVQD